MAKFVINFYVLLLICYQVWGENESDCPKLCQCEKNEENGLKVRCEKIKDVKEIIFGNISSEIVYL